jgi:hypothetical protein
MFNLSYNFLNNKYSKWYFNIIKNIQNTNRVKLKFSDSQYVYYERHHILPACIYPEYKNLYINKWNKVLLTPKEHFICHWLLTKCFDSTFCSIKMHHAMKMLNIASDQHSRVKYTSWQYQTIRISTNLANRGENAPMYGKKHSVETRKKISEAGKRRYRETPKQISPQELLRLQTMNIGRVRSEEQKQAIKDRLAISGGTFKGKKHSAKTRSILSTNASNRTNVRKDGIDKRIKINELEFYLSQGWEKGCIETEGNKLKKLKNKGRRHMNKDSVYRLIDHDKVDYFLQNGWVFGAKLGNLRGKH